MEKLLGTTQSQFEEFQKNGDIELWQKRNEGIVSYIKEARELINEHGSSQIIQQMLENNELENLNLMFIIKKL